MKESVCFPSLPMGKGASSSTQKDGIPASLARDYSGDTDQTQERGGGMFREQMGEERSPATPSLAPDSLKVRDNFLISKWMNGMNFGEERRDDIATFSVINSPQLIS